MKVKCPKCGKLHEMDDALIETVVPCERCEYEFIAAPVQNQEVKTESFHAVHGPDVKFMAAIGGIVIFLFVVIVAVVGMMTVSNAPESFSRDLFYDSAMDLLEESGKLKTHLSILNDSVYETTSAQLRSPPHYFAFNSGTASTTPEKGNPLEKSMLELKTAIDLVVLAWPAGLDSQCVTDFQNALLTLEMRHYLHQRYHNMIPTEPNHYDYEYFASQDKGWLRYDVYSDDPKSSKFPNAKYIPLKPNIEKLSKISKDYLEAGQKKLVKALSAVPVSEK